MITEKLNAENKPAMDLPLIKGGAPHATETGISSGLMGHSARMQT